MIHDDKQLGAPFVQFQGTKATIEAISSPDTGATAYATDTKQLGLYDGSSWRWFSPDDGINHGLGDHTDVTISSPDDEHILSHDGVDWKNRTKSSLKLATIDSAGAEDDMLLYYDGVFGYYKPRHVEELWYRTLIPGAGIVSNSAYGTQGTYGYHPFVSLHSSAAVFWCWSFDTQEHWSQAAGTRKFYFDIWFLITTGTGNIVLEFLIYEQEHTQAQATQIGSTDSIVTSVPSVGYFKKISTSTGISSSGITNGQGITAVVRRDKPGNPSDTLAASIYVTLGLLRFE